MTELTYEIVRELLDYDPETGALTWRPRDRKWFKSDRSWKAWGTYLSGKPAFTSVNADGYRQGKILYAAYHAHRIAWLHYYGSWPNDQIDHIDGDRANNRISNLRAVSQAENNRNMKRFCTNTSGLVGVCWDESRGKWMARITVGSKYKHLGRFDDFNDAAKARKAAEIKYGFHENHGRI